MGAGRVADVTPLDGGCISQDLPPSGTEEWRIQQNHSYLIRLEGVTECSGDTIHVHLFNPFRREDDPEDCYRPKCLPATRVGDGAYQFTVTFDQIEAKSYFIRYCTNADCSSGGVLARRSDGGNAPSTLVLTHFFPGCIPRAGHDKICLPTCCRYLSFDDLDLGCNPDRIPDCTELVDRIRCDDPSGVCCNFQVLPDCENGEEEPDPERGQCWFRRKVTYQVLTFAELEVCTVEGYIRWQVDTEPPVVNNVPDKYDLGCNPAEIPDCDDLIRLFGIEAKDNCPHAGYPILNCEAGPIEQIGDCKYRQVFRFWAVDKCGNRSDDYPLEVNWQVDTEPPVVNNVPETDKLPCNTRPTCDLLIARHNIHAKDNCTHEPPTLHCEPGEVVDLGNCRFRQTFTFWAVDKCGNRSRDYQLVVFWKEDTEPPVLHNVPEDRDLGCNPTHIPDCDEIRSGVYATDNCDPDVPVTCTYRDIVIGCLHIRSFILAAADECGNVTTRKVVVSWTEDTTPPIVRCPDNITVQAQFPDCLVRVTWRAKAEDDCDPRPSVACNPPSGSFFGLGTTTVTCTATDRCGNSASCQFTVTVLGYICGYKFRDDNGNGVWEPHLGEPPLAGWTINLYDADNNLIATTTTDATGRFCFLGLTSPGTYVVCERLQDGWVNTTPICRTWVLPRDCGKLVFFGNRPLK